ncbi:hypothetical protein EAH80_29335 [Mycobacterium hodleri]|uniref:Uncharacterized protein n=1 Tax=Mycolicibacterium hodleri TaxID=49897 RepID=A0A502DL77_9MYCO|nr:hypothetical protein EAH80_29335 [Mycolicibacterium hodleri]
MPVLGSVVVSGHLVEWFAGVDEVLQHRRESAGVPHREVGPVRRYLRIEPKQDAATRRSTHVLDALNRQ